MDFSQLGSTPISDDAPTGQDVRYEPSFEALSEEIAKLGNPSASSGINWHHVVELSAGILEKESKHLQVASYLCYGLAKTEGLQGFGDGLAVLRGIVENFWDGLFPPKKRMKGRRGIMVWWEEKVSEFMETADPVTWEKEKRDKLLDNLNSLDSFFDENLPDAPMLRPLIKQVKSVVSEKEEAPPPPEAPPEPAAEPAPPEPAAAPAPTQAPAAPVRPAAPPPVPEGDADALLKQGLTIISSAASQMMTQNKFDPLPYRLSRISAWTPLKNLPVATGGKTMLPPPGSQEIASIETLYGAGNWEALAGACESRVGQYLFWLDLSRYVAESMEQLGHPGISEVIASEASQFAGRLSGIETLAFSDGTPFADMETRDWLAQAAQSGTAAEGSAGAGDTISGKIREKTTEALGLVKEKKIDTALGTLMAPLGSASSEREKFLWKLAVCRLLIKAKQIQIASSYVDDILAAVETFNLEKWEPDNAVEAFSLALTALRLLKDDRHEEMIQSIIRKIAVLDPISALKIV